MDCYSTHIIATDLYFASMKTGTQWQADLSRGSSKCQSTAHAPTRTVECCEDAVTRALHKFTPMPLDRLLCETVVRIEELAPASITNLRDYNEIPSELKWGRSR